MTISRRAWMAGIAATPAAVCQTAPAPAKSPAAVTGFAASKALDEILTAAVRKDQMPGAVLLVGHHGEIVHRKAYGLRSLEPRREPMTVDTIFDIASLTKVVATTPAVMKLFEAGKLRVNDRVSEYLPEFAAGKQITVRDLLTHFSGLRPDIDLNFAWSGRETGIKMALAEKPVNPPGTTFAYSDINFILLGEIVSRLAAPLEIFARTEIFTPLGMAETLYLPPPVWRSRIAATEKVDGQIMHGVVHDPTSRRMGGVAGHAGVFSTADDLARYAEMMLRGGEYRGVRLFDPLTVTKFTTPQSPPNQPILRGLGWDLDSPLSASRGELFPIGSYGHTGFTGTSLWIDPVSETYVILLANSIHPRIRPALSSVRAKVATAVAAAVGTKAPGVTITGYNEAFVGAGLHRTVARNTTVLTGIDVLIAENFRPLTGRRVGLVTNHTGLDRDGHRDLDRMIAGGVKVTALFSPEHGIAGLEDQENVSNGTDRTTGVPVWSLYAGKNRRPTPEMLKDVDALVFDIQDIGTRFYTYITTMGYCLEAAAAHGIPFFVLDRPNPITGTHVEGPMLDADLLSFTGYTPLPVRHGMTAGELARLFRARKTPAADLHVIAARNWERGDWFDSTGLGWISPSPNMRSLAAALLYPGVALLEAWRDYSVGRGTDAPFEQIGAPWLKGPELSAYLNSRFIPGLRTYPIWFRPSASNFAGQTIEGVRFVITDREAFDSIRLGLEIASGILQTHPERTNLADNRWLIGNRRVIGLLEKGEDPILIQQEGEDALQAFLRLRQDYLLYR